MLCQWVYIQHTTPNLSASAATAWECLWTSDARFQGLDRKITDVYNCWYFSLRAGYSHLYQDFSEVGPVTIQDSPHFDADYITSIYIFIPPKPKAGSNRPHHFGMFAGSHQRKTMITGMSISLSMQCTRTSSDWNFRFSTQGREMMEDRKSHARFWQQLSSGVQLLRLFSPYAVFLSRNQLKKTCGYPPNHSVSWMWLNRYAPCLSNGWSCFCFIFDQIYQLLWLLSVIISWQGIGWKWLILLISFRVLSHNTGQIQMNVNLFSKEVRWFGFFWL